jgi:hypothetical protein
MTAGTLAASAAAAEPLGPKTDKPVTFLDREGGSVRPDFHSRKDRNRVFYAASLKQDRGWMWTTSIPNNPGDYDFKKYSVFAVFYKVTRGTGRPSDPFRNRQQESCRQRSRSIVTTPPSARHPLTRPILGGSTSSSRSTSARW